MLGATCNGTDKHCGTENNIEIKRTTTTNFQFVILQIQKKTWFLFELRVSQELKDTEKETSLDGSAHQCIITLSLMSQSEKQLWSEANSTNVSDK